jgi:hypothetical protein
MTETIKVEVDESLARRFRKQAMENYGYKKGSVKKALEELMIDYTQGGKTNWGTLRGTLKREYGSMTSTQLKHSLWSLRNDSHRRKRVS